jgi:hypothetical protein
MRVCDGSDKGATNASNSLFLCPGFYHFDESWIFGYDPETKQQSSKWKNPDSPR